ncbi:MAG: S8 family serine peptidase, partial [Pseudoxanthomonas sp.]
PGFGDTNGHGSHTASTAAGNSRRENFNGTTVTISGVAPRANVIAYDVCYTEVSTGRGLCPNVSSAAAVNQAMADGVDVINYSIGGGTQPWNEAVSLAFLNASNAGIFVAASAGNSGPLPGTLGHVEPWVTASAASQHGRGAFSVVLAVTGPGTPPAALQSVTLSAGSGGANLNGPLPGTTPLVVSPRIDAVDDGCVAYPANQFLNAIAVVRRGTCSFSIKVNSAAAAGAIAVVVANNAAGAISPSVPGTTIPAFGTTQVTGNALRDFDAAVATVTASVTPTVATNTVDALADFSSRGPTAYDLLKPDVTAPGVDILAAYAGTTISGSESLLATISGTSMASPHTAGAAALMRQLHPSWTVAEIKSALMMTASETVLLEDQVTPANSHAAGAGRLRVDLAARAGLVLNETTARYLAANPATGGDTTALNLASMQNADCVRTCTFVRTLRNTRPTLGQWQADFVGVSGKMTPAVLTLAPGESRQVQITISNLGHPANGTWRYGTMVLKPHAKLGVSGQPNLHLPIAVSVLPPPPPSTPLVNGVPLAVSGATGSQAYYSLVVPAGRTTLSFVMQGGTGDADLFVRRGQVPSDAFYDCTSAGGTNNETCTFNSPQAGTWYVRIVGFTAYAGATLTGTHQ